MLDINKVNSHTKHDLSVPKNNPSILSFFVPLTLLWEVRWLLFLPMMSVSCVPVHTADDILWKPLRLKHMWNLIHWAYKRPQAFIKFGVSLYSFGALPFDSCWVDALISLTENDAWISFLSYSLFNCSSEASGSHDWLLYCSLLKYSTCEIFPVVPCLLGSFTWLLTDLFFQCKE